MNKYFLRILVIVSLGMLLTAGQVMAGKIFVTVKNLTNGLYFTPLLITAHDSNSRLFELGVPASEELQVMAEGGNIGLLTEMVGGADQDTIVDPVGGLLGPGEVVSDIKLNTRKTRNRYLSMTAMLLPTNDGFVGLDSIFIPKKPGMYSFYLYGYDAGTEANDELITGGGAPGVSGIPGAPGGHGGVNGTGVALLDTNTTVHIHRGTIGDLDTEGGISDLDSSIHRWLNPVAELVIEVPGRKSENDDNDDD
ncbi:MAG: hypothetical protein GY799_13805 [Desulfobulbaceae bacterium]|nr:hypothetical protein [Desulfobulbaceae bacterium]